MRVDLAGIGGSALTDRAIEVPQTPTTGIPVTYVPARNTIMLSLALGWAEVLGARDIFMRRECGRLFRLSGLPARVHRRLRASSRRCATKAGVEGKRHARPGATDHRMTKAQIIAAGLALGVDFSATVSCYQADEQGRACGRCDSCRIRAGGFRGGGHSGPHPIPAL